MTINPRHSHRDASGTGCCSNGINLSTLFKLNNNNGSRTHVTADLTAFKGQTVTLWFNVHLDGPIIPPTTAGCTSMTSLSPTAEHNTGTNPAESSRFTALKVAASSESGMAASRGWPSLRCRGDFSNHHFLDERPSASYCHTESNQFTRCIQASPLRVFRRWRDGGRARALRPDRRRSVEPPAGRPYQALSRRTDL